MADEKKRKTISVRLDLKDVTEGQAPPTPRAYLFDRAGQLVSSKIVGKDAVRFEVDASQPYRVTVGPDLIGERKEAPPNLADRLIKAKAVSQDFLPNQPESAQLAIHPNLWICWFPTCINVHGTVSKQMLSGPNAAICYGTVQIFQVDLGCTLDSFTVFDLNYFKLQLLQKLTLPATQAVSNLGGKSPSFARSAQSHLMSRAASSSSAFSVSSASSASLSESAAAIQALNGSALKQYLIANKVILFPFWCELIPDYAFCWQELTEVPIQSDGTFNAEICFWCPADYPDLYFEVIQNINGTDVEIYDPQIACSTYYNYDGSQSVDITVTDPRAVACLNTDGTGPHSLYVWPTAIGNEPLNGIDGLETLLGTGLLPGGTGARPFGGTLSLQMNFHPGLRAAGIKYYRWSYKFDGDPDPPKVISVPVTHRYQTSFTPPITIASYNLGPQTINGTPNLFEIPDPGTPWVNIVDPLDRPYAYFDTTEGAPPTRSGFNSADCSGTTGRIGMCTLILEVFDHNGQFVSCNNARGSSTLGDQPGPPPPIKDFGFLLPQVGGPPNVFDFAPTPNITDQGRLIFRIFVDNEVCTAQIAKVASPLNSTDTDPCGILHYNNPSDNVAISYVAFHPNNFLDWDMTVSLGVLGVVASIPPSPPPTNTNAGSPGSPAVFNNPVSTLLQPPVGPPCTQGALSAVLYAAARATDGYERLAQYDCQAVGAFALTQPCPDSSGGGSTIR